jgi:O-antigen/teichoic acid export membrane protein
VTTADTTPRRGRPGLQAVVFSALTLTVNLLTGVLIARALDTDGRGEITAILQAPLLLGAALGLGCGTAVAYHLSRHPDDGPRLLGTWLVMLVPIGITALAAGLLLVPVLMSAQTDEAIHLGQLYVVTIVLVIFAELTYGLLLGHQDFLFYLAIVFAHPAATAIAFVALWASGAFSVESAVMTSAIVSVAGTTIAFGRLLGKQGFGRPNLAIGRSTLWYGVRSHGTSLGGQVNTRLDLLIMPAILAASSVGLYAVATSVSWIVVSFSAMLGTVVMPAATRQGPEGHRTVITALHAVLLISGLIALVLGLAADLAVRLVYGPSFADSVLPLQILLPGSVLWAGATILVSGLYAANRPLTAFAPQAVGMLVTVVGLALFLEGGGIEAAAVITSASYALVFVGCLVLYRRATRLPWSAFRPDAAALWGSLRRAIPMPARLRVRGAAGD